MASNTFQSTSQQYVSIIKSSFNTWRRMFSRLRCVTSIVSMNWKFITSVVQYVHQPYHSSISIEYWLVYHQLFISIAIYFNISSYQCHLICNMLSFECKCFIVLHVEIEKNPPTALCCMIIEHESFTLNLHIKWTVKNCFLSYLGLQIIILSMSFSLSISLTL